MTLNEDELKRYRKRLNPCRFCGSLGVDLYSFQTLRMDTYVGVKCAGCGTKIPPVMVLGDEKPEWDSAVDIAIKRWKGVN